MSFLACTINDGGYIHAHGIERVQGRMVHKETRQMNDWAACCEHLVDAQLLAGIKQDALVIELDSDGGGDRIHIWANQEELIRERLKPWNCCYGEWEVVIHEMHPR